MDQYVLKLFVTGRSGRSQEAIDNLQRILQESLPEQYQLEVIDVLEDPQAAEDAKVLATPAVVRELPLPIRRIIGDLSQRDQVLLGLEIQPCSDRQTDKGEQSDDG